MTTLYLDRKGLTLRYAAGRLDLLAAGERVRSVPVALLERVVIHARTQLDSGVLAGLAEHGVAVAVLSPRHGRRLAIVLGRPHNDVAVRLAQAARWRDPEWCLTWSRDLVRRRLAGQLRCIRDLIAARPDRRYALTGAERRLQAILPSLAGASTVASLRGLEGAATAAYFEGLTSVFPPSVGFTGRNRRPPRDPVNACLSLAYTLLHFEAVRAAYAAGLDPYVGFYHAPAFGRESLASDLIEPLRASLDAWVWRRFRDRTLRAHHFNRDKGACLLGKEGRAMFYRAYEEGAGPMRRALRRTALLLAREMRRHTVLEEDDERPTGPLS